MNVIIMPEVLDYDEIKIELTNRVRSRNDVNRKVGNVDVWSINDRLACIVVGRADLCIDVNRTINKCLRNGVAAWLIFPNTRRIEAYNADCTITVFRDTKVLMSEYLPGFELPLVELFPTENGDV